MTGMKLALFDLDNTLLAGDSDYAWAQFLIEEGVLERGVYETRNQFYYEHYKAGTLDIFEYLAFQSAPLVNRSQGELETWHAHFMERKIRPMILPKARALIASHADALVAIITATNRFITAPIVEELGIPNLIACELEQVDGKYTGRGTGVPAFREGKVQRVEMWLAEQGKTLKDFSESYFYSDSHNDLPLLKKVTHPVAVDPDPTLRAHAEKHGWPVISLR
jgi:HAD superfamily hydrolase (TIGR01490 family)